MKEILKEIEDNKKGTYKSLYDMVGSFRASVLPPERISVSEAAEKYRHVYQPPVYTGPWQNEVAPYLVEIMNTLESKDFSAVCFVSAAQSCKTDVNFNWLSYIVKCDPSDFMIVEKSQDEGRSFSKMKLDRVMRHSKALRDLQVTHRSSDNVFDKLFKSGAFLKVAWPTINHLSGKTLRRVSISDYDRMPDDIGGEGSIFSLARRRTNVYKRLGMTYVESSPSKEVKDLNWQPRTPHEAPPCNGILGIYNQSDRRRRYWQCPHCGEWFEPSFSLLRWNDSQDVKECGESAYMACPHCFDSTGAMILPHQKREIDSGGVWLREGETVNRQGIVSGQGLRSDIAGFWLKGPATAFGMWSTLVINYVSALRHLELTGDNNTLMTTVNTDQGEPFFPEKRNTVITPEKLMQDAVDYEEAVPDGTRVLVAAVDVQGNRFEVQVHAIIPHGDSFDIAVIDRFAITKSNRLDPEGHPYPLQPNVYAEDWDRIEELVLEKTYDLPDGSGRKMAIAMVGCDSGGKAGTTEKAYKFYRKIRRERVYAGRFLLLKGDPKKEKPRVMMGMPDSERKDRQAGARGEIPVLMLNTKLLKDWLFSTLQRKTPGGRIFFSNIFDLDFYKELFVEEFNEKTQVYENPKRKRNETTDLIYYAYGICLSMEMEKLDWGKPGTFRPWALPWEKNPFVMGGNQDLIAKSKELPQTIDKLKELAQRLG